MTLMRPWPFQMPVESLPQGRSTLASFSSRQQSFPGGRSKDKPLVGRVSSGNADPFRDDGFAPFSRFGRKERRGEA